MMLWRIFGYWRNETACECRKIYNEALKDLYSSTAIFRLIKSRRIKFVGHLTCMGDWRVLQRVLVGKPEGNIPLGRLKLRRENIIKMNFQEVRCSGTS